MVRAWSQQTPARGGGMYNGKMLSSRHARARRGHPSLDTHGFRAEGWIAGSSPAMTAERISEGVDGTSSRLHTLHDRRRDRGAVEAAAADDDQFEPGRASCRERGCQFV